MASSEGKLIDELPFKLWMMAYRLLFNFHGEAIVSEK